MYIGNSIQAKQTLYKHNGYVLYSNLMPILIGQDLCRFLWKMETIQSISVVSNVDHFSNELLPIINDKNDGHFESDSVDDQ